MNLEDWEEFWAHLVGDYSIMEEMGTNHLDTVGEFLEWQRQEWIKYHHGHPDCGITKAGRKIIGSELPAKVKTTTFDDAVSLVMYQIYNWLGIHGAPVWVLDLFIPFLCYKTTPADVVRDLWLHPQGLIAKPNLDRGIHEVLMV